MNLSLSNLQTEGEIELFRRFYFTWAAFFLLVGLTLRFPFVSLATRHGISAEFGIFSVSSAPVHALVGIVAAIALVGAAWGGRFASFASAAALPLIYIYFFDIAALRPTSVAGRIGRESCQLFVFLALFLARPRPGLEARWFHAALRLAVVFPYFCAGVQKLLFGGEDWWSGRALQSGLLQWSITGASPISAALAASTPLCVALSVFVITVELLSPLAVLFPFVAPALFVFAMVFHGGTRLLLGPNFLEYFAPSFVIFLFPLLRRRR